MRPWLLSLLLVALPACQPVYSRCEGREIHHCHAPRAGEPRPIVEPPCDWESKEAAPCEVACIEFRGVAFCASSTERSPLCPLPSEDIYQGTGGSVCDGATIVDCKEGYEVARGTTCPVACAATISGGRGFHDAFCALEDQPNAACSRMFTSCVDGQLVACWRGFVESAHPCTDGTTCQIIKQQTASEVGEAACTAP